TEYSIVKSNQWRFPHVVGKGLPPAQFVGGDARKLSLDLLFDASDSPRRDVRDATNQLFHMMEVNEHFGTPNKNNARPPTVEFGWGGVITFKAVCESLTVQFTLFKPNGVPIRAQAKLSLTQIEKVVSGQNPTTRGLAGVGSHVVRDGDSLQSVA